MTELSDQKSLDRSLIQGITWTGGARWASQLLSWLSTFVVARILTPEDYGLVGMAFVYVGLVQTVSTFGVGAAIIQQRDLSEDQLAYLGGLNLCLGTLFCLLSLAAAAPLASFFREPEVRWIAMVYGGTFVLASLQVLPSSLLRRELRFKLLAGLRFAQGLATMVTTLALAIAGLGYWALVLGHVIGRCVAVIALITARPHRIAFPTSLSRIRGSLSFGLYVMVSRLAWYAYSNADFAIVGRVLGKALLGAYTFGWQLASIPVDRISAILNRVLLPIYSAVQDKPDELLRYLLRLAETLALVTFPLSLGLAIVADDFVATTIGPQWGQAVWPLRILSCYAGFRSIDVLFHSLLTATGNARREAILKLVALAVLPPLFYVGTIWGVEGVALSWLVGLPFVIMAPTIYSVSQVIPLRLHHLTRAIWPGLSSSLLMVLAVYLVRLELSSHLNSPLRLILQVLAGGVCYGLALLVFHRARITAFVSFVKQLRKTKDSSASRAPLPAEL